jgi:hypothetical protein
MSKKLLLVVAVASALAISALAADKAKDGGWREAQRH